MRSNPMKLIFKCIAILCLVILQSCSNDSPFSTQGSSDIRIGSGTGASFIEGELELGNAFITQGGSSTVKVNLVDANGALASTAIASVTFTSGCANTSQALFSPNTIEVINGTASSTYTDVSCSNIDTITATATLTDDSQISATGSISFTSVTQLGAGSGSGFQAAQISIENSSIITGGNTDITVNIVDQNNALVTSLSTLSFTSTCTTTDQASFTLPTVYTTNGTATSTYRDEGCLGADFITVTLTNGASDNLAQGQITITPLRIGTGSGANFVDSAISFTPSNISEGETTTVSVNISDSNGTLITTPVTVNFSSSCSLADPASASFTNMSVTTATGTASTTYQDAGCASDAVTATLNTVSDTDPSSFGSIVASPLRLGSGSAGSFIENVLTLGLSSVSAGGTTSVSVNVVDSSNALISTPVTVSFESNCVTQGIASFDSDTASTVNGTANVTYTAAAGCSGTDTIQATINPYGNNERSAASEITIASPEIGSIQFTSTDSNTIALKGTGNSSTLSENAILTFTVLDATGNPKPGVDVIFSLNTSLGEISLQSNTDTSDAQGLVQAIVQSGTVSTSVRVTADILSPVLSTQSTSIVISTGLPVQSAFSLSSTNLRPQAWNHDGIEVTITARLADRFNNPIQDGTNINFTTELGSIDSTCTTANNEGACSVVWRSQSPRGTSGATNIGSTSNQGRVTILAHVEGEESFIDADGNGVYSTDDGNLASNAFIDLSEPFVDWDEDGLRDSTGLAEPFKDFSNFGNFDAGDGAYNGVVCTHSSECGTPDSTFVRDSIVIIMAEDNPVVVKVDSDSGNICDNTNTATNDDCFAVAGTTGISYPKNLRVGTFTKTLTFSIVGATNWQLLPTGTIIKFENDNGKLVGNDIEYANDSNANTHTLVAASTSAIATYVPTNMKVAQYSITIARDTTPSIDGSISFNAETPNGITTNFVSVTIDDRPFFISIDLPTTNSFKETSEFTLAGTALDPEDTTNDGDISAGIVWTSSLDGALGTGASILVNGTTPLSSGNHTIVATSTNAAGDIVQTTKDISITASPPTLTNTTGSNTYATGTAFDLTATATDPEDGDISANITWTSNIDGPLGTGATVTTNDSTASPDSSLTVGDHTITASITDAQGNTVTSTVAITITL